MQISFSTLVLVASAALSAAAPGKGPPGPPEGTVGGVSQSCSASQSSIHCCQANGNKVGKGKKKDVFYPDGSAQLVCSQILEGDKNKQVQSICSTTVACCIGDGCIAIAY